MLDYQKKSFQIEKGNGNLKKLTLAMEPYGNMLKQLDQLILVLQLIQVVKKKLSVTLTFK